MTHRRVTIVVCCWVVTVACLLVWRLVSPAGLRGGRVAVSFLGVTNDATGATAALFRLTNGLGRDIGFAAGPIEIDSPEGWPKGSNYTVYVLTHLGPAYKLGALRTQGFSVPITNVSATNVWRVPVVYATIGSRLDAWLDNVKIIFKRPVGGVVWSTYSPEMVGLSNRATQTIPQ